MGDRSTGRRTLSHQTDTSGARRGPPCLPDNRTDRPGADLRALEHFQQAGRVDPSNTHRPDLDVAAVGMTGSYRVAEALGRSVKGLQHSANASGSASRSPARCSPFDPYLCRSVSWNCSGNQASVRPPRSRTHARKYWAQPRRLRMLSFVVFRGARLRTCGCVPPQELTISISAGDPVRMAAAHRNRHSAGPVVDGVRGTELTNERVLVQRCAWLSPMARRNLAVLAVLYAWGPAFSELVTPEREDIRLDGRSIVLHLPAKRGLLRTLPLGRSIDDGCPERARGRHP